MRDLPEYEKNIQGQLSCFDRIILFGTFGNIAYPDVMTLQLKLMQPHWRDHDYWIHSEKNEG